MKPFKRMLIANRGEIAIRIARSAKDLGIQVVTVFPEDDQNSSHVEIGTHSTLLPGRGSRAYLDGDQLIAAARQFECDAIHPGYGFLSENSEFAAKVRDAGIKFVGPSVGVLELLGEKTRARQLAIECGVPVAPGTAESASVEAVRQFIDSLGSDVAVMLKPVAGGGGRGMRVVTSKDDLETEYEAAQREAKAAFGLDGLYCELYVEGARHIEVQIVGDGQSVSHVWERDCTLQRRHQKLVEIAPAPGLSAHMRESLLQASIRMADAANCDSLATFEFLVNEDASGLEHGFVFLEANPRLQVEHTVTEAVTGTDLVAAQISIAAGATLDALDLAQSKVPEPRGYALEARINAETFGASGDVLPAMGTISRFEVPTGPGVRVDTCGFAGFVANASFDSLLAKVIVHSFDASFHRLARQSSRALSEFKVIGIDTNIPLIRAILERLVLNTSDVDTKYVERHLDALRHESTEFMDEQVTRPDDRALDLQTDDGSPLVASMSGTVVEVLTVAGDQVRAGQKVAVIEAMKMEHVEVAPTAGIVRRVLVAPGEQISSGGTVLLFEPTGAADPDEREEEEYDLDEIRPDLESVQQRVLKTRDEGRPNAVARRHDLGYRTIRENIDDLVDEGSFTEYGALVLAAQRARRSDEELQVVSPADGLVSGIAEVNGAQFDRAHTKTVVMGYDWTVFGGTQGLMGHKKMDRLLKLAESHRLPVVFFAEGGGGRPGETEYLGASGGLENLSFWYLGNLNGLVPLIGITNRYSFAGNAAVLALCDVIIATKQSNIGMGGPAMIDGGGLGKVAASSIGPSDEQAAVGVIDILVEDEADAVRVAKNYLSYFQGPIDNWECGDQRELRRSVPENRKRAYDVRSVIDLIADLDSVLEIRREFGAAVVTSFIRVEGRPVGVVANNPLHLGGAIDADGADKSARFMQLCDAFSIPILMLVDTPGFMVGPEAEKSAQARHFGRMFATAANLTTPIFSVVLRKGYGLGAMASAGGGFHACFFTIAWPTGEFGPMGFEGAVRLAYSKELEQLKDEDARQHRFQELVDEMYVKGAALSAAEYGEIDAVIDPSETRAWILHGLESTVQEGREHAVRKYVDTW